LCQENKVALLNFLANVQRLHGSKSHTLCNIIGRCRPILPAFSVYCKCVFFELTSYHPRPRITGGRLGRYCFLGATHTLGPPVTLIRPWFCPSKCFSLLQVKSKMFHSGPLPL